MHKRQIAISIVCPFFNEENMVDLFMKEITAVVNELNKPFEVVCVNDGSTDNTLAKLLQAKEDYPNMKIINFSRNFGKEAALTAGLDYAKGEMIIPIDADLQDPPELIKDFISYREKGYDVVVAKRVDRSTDSIAKKITAQLFYKFHNKIAQTKIPDNVGDYRLIPKLSDFWGRHVLRS